MQLSVGIFTAFDRSDELHDQEVGVISLLMAFLICDEAWSVILLASVSFTFQVASSLRRFSLSRTTSLLDKLSRTNSSFPDSFGKI